jgi:hypothetical protein
MRWNLNSTLFWVSHTKCMVACKQLGQNLPCLYRWHTLFTGKAVPYNIKEQLRHTISLQSYWLFQIRNQYFSKLIINRFSVIELSILGLNFLPPGYGGFAKQLRVYQLAYIVYKLGCMPWVLFQAAKKSETCFLTQHLYICTITHNIHDAATCVNLHARCPPEHSTHENFGSLEIRVTTLQCIQTIPKASKQYTTIH